MTALEPLRVGVIGVGFIGQIHARIYHELPTAELVGVADTDAAQAEAVARRLGCEFSTDIAGFCQRHDVEAVSICTPDRYHLEPSLMAAEAGTHILLEKPIARTVAEAKKIRDAADSHGIRLMVGQLLRFDPRYATLHELIAAGELGDLIHLRIKRQNPRLIQEQLKGRTSMLYYVGVHDIDFALWCVPSPVREVYAKKGARMHAEDCVFALYTFEDGTVGTLELSWSLPETFPAGIWSEVEVAGTKGSACIEVRNQGLAVHTNQLSYPDTLHWPEYNGRIGGDLRDELAHFVEALRNDSPFLVDTDDTIRAVGFIEACLGSIAAGTPVKPDYPPA